MTSSEQTMPASGTRIHLRLGSFAQHAWHIGRGIRPTVAVSILFIAFLLLAALFPPALASHDPLSTDPLHAFAAPSLQHLFGTDENGRDVWSRIICGARPSLLLGLIAAALTTVLGILLGLVAGLNTRLLGHVIMRLVEILQSIPDLLLVLLIVSLFGFSTLTLVISLGVAAVPIKVRQVRAQVLVVRRAHFVEAAYTLGIPDWLVILRHVVPNSIRPVLVLLPLEVGWKIALLATLSFLGVGAPPPAPLWGSMLAIDRDYVLNAWWLTATPAAVIVLTVLAINTLGRDLVRRSEGKT